MIQAVLEFLKTEQEYIKFNIIVGGEQHSHAQDQASLFLFNIGVNKENENVCFVHQTAMPTKLIKL